MAEANLLAAKIGQNLLQCAICHEQFRDPRALPCQHGFCTECLEGWAQKSKVKGKLVCPICREEVALSEEGVKGLPVHFLVSSLKEICEGDRQVQVECSNCNTPGKNAKVHCFDCKEYFCDECHTLHKGLKLNKHHKVVTIEDLQSGKVSDEGRYCKVHGELVRYYCETERRQVCIDCVSLKTCSLEHERTTLKEAAEKQSAAIERLVKECGDTRKEFQDAVQKIKRISKDFDEAKTEARRNLDEARQKYIHEIEQIFQKQEAEISKVDVERTKEISDTEVELEKHLVEIEKACKHSLAVIQSESDYQITSSYVSLVNNLKNLKKKPMAVKETLRYLKFQTFTPVIDVRDHLKVQMNWELVVTSAGLPVRELRSIAVNQEGFVAVHGYGWRLQMFARKGDVTYVPHGCPFYMCDVALTPDNKYIINVDGTSNFLCCDRNGNKLSKIKYDEFYQPSTAYGIAVDGKGRIIAGLKNNIIALHNADGTSISKFSTHAAACQLAVTSNGELVVRFENGTLKLMDYSGGNQRGIQSPPNAVTWKPTYVCSSHKYEEIFVVNEGDPKAVYSFTADGDYLGCITTEVTSPAGIALSKDEQEIFVAENSGSQIKIFQRPD